MKKELNGTTIAVTLGVIAIVIAAIAFTQFGPSLSKGPEFTPKPFSPPAGYKAPNTGAPVGAPAQPQGAGAQGK